MSNRVTYGAREMCVRVWEGEVCGGGGEVGGVYALRHSLRVLLLPHSAGRVVDACVCARASLEDDEPLVSSAPTRGTLGARTGAVAEVVRCWWEGESGAAAGVRRSVGDFKDAVTQWQSTAFAAVCTWTYQASRRCTRRPALWR